MRTVPSAQPGLRSRPIRQPLSACNPSQRRSMRTLPSTRPRSPQSAYQAAPQRVQSQPAPIHGDAPLHSAPVPAVSLSGNPSARPIPASVDPWGRSPPPGPGLRSRPIRQPVSAANPSQRRSMGTLPLTRPGSPQSAYPAASQRVQSPPVSIHGDTPLRPARVHSVSPSRSLAVESPQLSTPRCEVLTTRPPGTTPLHTQRKTPVLGVKPHPQRQRPWA